MPKQFSTFVDTRQQM